MKQLNLLYCLFVALCAALLAILPTGCTDTATPVNLEPTIEVIEAAEVTRTSAVISANINQRGLSGLTYVSFHYGENGQADQYVVVDDDSKTGIVSCRLSGLRPNTTYTWFVEGRTSTATLKSKTSTFTTEPNDRPAVSPLVELSYGPVGVIVSFDITDDGGEAILEAGCEIIEKATLNSAFIYLAPDHLETGSHRLNISGLKPETSYTIVPFASNSSGETKGEPLEYTTGNCIMLSEAGSLAQLFEGMATVDLTELVIAGKMNGDDFRFLRMLLGAPLDPGVEGVGSSVEAVDLADAEIVVGGGTFDGKHHTVAGQLSTGLFADCVKLRNIKLPSSALALSRDAFARCRALETLTVSANIESVLPSAGCNALRAIEVSAANNKFASADGVLFNRDLTEILWFPLGKTGAYNLPSTITSIGEGAFTGTSITSLNIPASVTTISRGAFAGSSLVEISLPDNVAVISDGMFQNCSTLTLVRLGAGTEFVGNYVFDGTCLKDLYVAAAIPPFAETKAFDNRMESISDNCTLHVPSGSKAMYSNHSVWKRFSKIVEF